MGVARNYIERWIYSIVLYRDDWVTKVGTEVDVTYPAAEIRNVYLDKTVTSAPIIKRVPIAFDWKAYRLALSYADTSEEQNVPLTGVCRAIDDIPADSLVTIFGGFTPDGIQFKGPTIYQVVKTEPLHQRFKHGNKLTMVPYRGVSHQ